LSPIRYASSFVVSLLWWSSSSTIVALLCHNPTVSLSIVTHKCLLTPSDSLPWLMLLCITLAILNMVPRFGTLLAHMLAQLHHCCVLLCTYITIALHPDINSHKAVKTKLSRMIEEAISENGYAPCLSISPRHKKSCKLYVSLPQTTLSFCRASSSICRVSCIENKKSSYMNHPKIYIWRCDTI
jgi:hypothetical protein